MTVSRKSCARIAPSAVRIVYALAVILAVGGCLDRELTPLRPCTSSVFERAVAVTYVQKIDLLFVVDDSGSMEQEQRSLIEELPRLVEILASGDELLDGTVDFPPIVDMHVSVVGTDMGVGGFRIDSAACDDASNFGDDGLFRSAGRGTSCNASYPQVQSYLRDAPGADPATFAQGVGCVANLGLGGCGLEQQLESMLKSVTPADSDIRFFSATQGHGGTGANTGFLREDSLLVVVLVSDEDDCSTTDTALLDASNTTYPGVPNVRCQLNPGALLPVARYADGLRALRAGREDLLIFATITGVPVDLVGSTPAQILADSRMQVTLTSDSRDLEPACTSRNADGSDRGKAAPGRRFVELAAALGERGIVQSICQESFEPAIDEVIKRVGNVLRQVCLPRPLNPTATGEVNCEVIEALPLEGDVTRCAQLGGRVVAAESPDADGREVCVVQQLARDAVTGGAGWFYDDFTDATTDACGVGGRRIAFAPGSESPSGAAITLRCLQPVSGGADPAAVQVGSFCDPSAAADVCVSASLFCEPSTRACQESCDTDADCKRGFLCDATPGNAATRIFCINPTCG